MVSMGSCVDDMTVKCKVTVSVTYRVTAATGLALLTPHLCAPIVAHNEVVPDSKSAM